MTHVLLFFIAMLSACSYYAMWQGMGVLFKVAPRTWLCPRLQNYSVRS